MILPLTYEGFSQLNEQLRRSKITKGYELKPILKEPMLKKTGKSEVLLRFYEFNMPNLDGLEGLQIRMGSGVLDADSGMILENHETRFLFSKFDTSGGVPKISNFDLSGCLDKDVCYALSKVQSAIEMPFKDGFMQEHFAVDSKKFIINQYVLLNRFSFHPEADIQNSSTKATFYSMLGKSVRSIKGKYWTEYLAMVDNAPSLEDIREHVIGNEYLPSKYKSDFDAFIARGYVTLNEAETLSDIIESTLTSSGLSLMADGFMHDVLGKKSDTVSFRGKYLGYGYNKLTNNKNVFELTLVTPEGHKVIVQSGSDFHFSKPDIINACRNRQEIEITGEIIDTQAHFQIGARVRPAATVVKPKTVEFYEQVSPALTKQVRLRA
ncbi:TPA: hypothetical protein I7730_14010 [Vibrio vulnificus]|uniref:Uncharacterized protein n=1 Tax=Vibrio vulnificus TaxID=672 RepID=A0A8H9N168_VIBVL|nr:hypothetical protein [Vibrio vulnificus]HAS8540900.1 hypothetical protein [Vibrio vulnificus]